MPAPTLLLMAPTPEHPFDLYTEELLLTEGYGALDRLVGGPEGAPLELPPSYALAVISAGAARLLPAEVLRAYLHAGGRAIILRPPPHLAPLLGLQEVGETYSVARDAYVAVNTGHRWMEGIAAANLQCPGETDVYRADGAEALAYVAGQLGLASPFPAVALHRVGAGAAVTFTYDLARTVVEFHQGRPENDNLGADPDANRDGKLCPDDFLEGLRDFSLRHVPQADIHQDILTRAIVGLTADALPVPRLWHFPNAAPAAFMVNGDGDGMLWEDLQWVLETIEPYGVKYTFYLMEQQIQAFSAEQVAAVRERGHDFGPHPWAGLRPTVGEWEREVSRIVESFAGKLGFSPTSYRSHCTVFPGWDEAPRIAAASGLRLDTNFVSGVRFVSGYANGSALPVKFINTAGEIVDCYEQSTVHTEDGCMGSKYLLPPLSQDECIELSRGILSDLCTRYHGVYHPYFHPISLTGRGSVECDRWFVAVLEEVKRHGLPSLTAHEWLHFNDARRGFWFEDVIWDEPTLDLTVSCPEAIFGLTVLLPPCRGQTPCVAAVDGEVVELEQTAFEGLCWTTLILDMGAGETKRVTVDYGPCPEGQTGGAT